VQDVARPWGSILPSACDMLHEALPAPTMGHMAMQGRPWWASRLLLPALMGAVGAGLIGALGLIVDLPGALGVVALFLWFLAVVVFLAAGWHDARSKGRSLVRASWSAVRDTGRLLFFLAP